MLTPQQFEAQVKSRAIPAQQSQGIVNFLEQSELWMIQLMNENQCPPGPSKTPTPGQGDVEFGLLPYWLNNPPTGFGLDGYLKIIVDYFGITTQITTTQYNCFFNKADTVGIIGGDGTLWATSPYAQLDTGWIYSLLNWFVNWLFDDTVTPFPNSPQTICITPQASNGDAIIALVSDWGTGNYNPPSSPATDVMNGIMAYKPDAIVHLGDTYYSGTPNRSSYFNPGEEAANLVNLWPTGVANSFTLNSNHEMCSGGNGYFPVLSQAPFQQQNGTSYFALQVAGWTILGLDTAYNAEADTLYMYGCLNQQQISWIQSLKLTASKVIVLSHHNALSYEGNARSPVTDTTWGDTLWAQVNYALGGDPAAWYWGHIHDGIAYSYPAPAAPDGATVNTYARCIGNGAIPYGNAWGLEAYKGNWTFYSNTAYPHPSVNVYNGYVILTIASNGGVTEQFCDISPAAKQTAQYNLGTNSGSGG